MTSNNNIPKGYKQTKLGIIPEEWKVDRIDNVFEFIRTNSLSRSKLNYDVKENSIYNIHYGDIHATFTKPILDLEEENRIPVINNDVDISKFSFLNEGDLIIADASEDYDGVGKAIELKNVKQKNLVAGLHTFALRDITNKTSLGYRTYIFKNAKVSNRLKTIATGSKVYGISKSNLSKFEIVFPPLLEQKAIAKILSTWDKAIETQTALIDKKKLYKKALMQKLLKPNPDSNREDWKEVRLGECLVKGELGGNYSNSELNQGLPLMKMGNIGRGEFKLTKIENIPKNSDYDEQFVLNEGDLLFNTRNTLGLVGKVAIWRNELPRALYNSNLMRLSFDKRVEPSNRFMNYFFNSYCGLSQLRSFAIGTTSVAAIYTRDLKLFKMYLPSIQTQTKIANILSSADKEISILEQQLVKLKEQKRGLMQVLLTGKKRVKLENN